MKNARRFRDYLNKQLKDPAVCRSYQEEGLFIEKHLRAFTKKLRKNVVSANCRRQVDRLLRQDRKLLKRLAKA